MKKLWVVQTFGWQSCKIDFIQCYQVNLISSRSLDGYLLIFILICSMNTVICWNNPLCSLQNDFPLIFRNRLVLMCQMSHIDMNFKMFNPAKRSSFANRKLFSWDFYCFALCIFQVWIKCVCNISRNISLFRSFLLQFQVLYLFSSATEMVEWLIYDKSLNYVVTNVNLLQRD